MVLDLSKARLISNNELSEKIAEHEQKNLKVDQRFKNLLDTDKHRYYTHQIEEINDFYNLIWCEIRATRILSNGESRTLRDIANRFIECKLTFEDLVDGTVEDTSTYKPGWYKKCLPINNGFEYENFGWLAVHDASQKEINQSPNGKYYIYDGSHKSLVLAIKLFTGEEEFQPVDVIYIDPKP